MNRAVRKYVEFHSHEPVKIGSFHLDLEIPEQAMLVGDAVNVLYTSDKLNPTDGRDEGWIDYIHEHGRGVRVYRCDRSGGGRLRTVPAWIHGARELTWLGNCLGFEYTDLDGHSVEAKGTGTLPELYTIPSGKALLVIQGKRTVLALIWGGKLGVEHRGIVH
jgi:hypothetical protein